MRADAVAGAHRRIDFGRINAAALTALPRLLQSWLPGGRRHGVEYVARVLRCDPKTIWHGMKDLEEPQDAAAGRVRKKGGPQVS